MTTQRTLFALASLGLLLGGCPQPVPDAPPVDTTQVAPTGTPTAPAQAVTPTPSPFQGPSGDEAVSDALGSVADGDFDAARAELNRLLNDPEVGQYAAYNLGVIAFRQAQEAEAIDHFEDALQRDPTFTAPLVAILRIHLRDGDVSAARRAFDAQVSRSGSDPSIRAAGLYIALHEGRHEQVIREGRDLLLEDEENLDVFYTMARAYLDTNRPELAEYIISQGLGRDNSRVEFPMLQAQIALANDDMVSAQTHLQRVLQIDPYNAEAHNNLGVVRNRLRNYSRAEESFLAATSYAPDYAEAWLNLGNARKGQSNYTGAQQAYERALQVRSGYADAYYNLALLYLDAELEGLSREERLVQSLAYFDQYLSANGSPATGHPYFAYRREAQSLLDTERDLQLQQSGGGFDDSGGFGDDGGGFGDDDGGFGDDDGFGDDWGDSGGDDDGFGDDWDDSGGDDDGADDGFGDDWNDAESDDEEEEESDDEVDPWASPDESGSEDDEWNDEDWEDPW